MAGEIDKLLSSWTAKHRIELTPSDDQGRYFLVFDARYEVAFSQLGDQIMLELPLGALPVKHKEAEEMLETIMGLQLAHAQKSRAVVTLEEDQRSLTLFQTLKTGHLTELKFERVITNFVNAAAFFDTQIEPDALPHTPDAPIPAPGQFFI